MEQNEDQKVGFKRPPRHTQFQPGVSGNPGGRPRRLPNFISDLQDELTESTTIHAGGRAIQVSKQRAVAKALVDKALTGEVRAVAALVTLVRDQPADAEQMGGPDRALLQEYIDREIKRRQVADAKKSPGEPDEH
jgi:hypothetical protein